MVGHSLAGALAGWLATLQRMEITKEKSKKRKGGIPPPPPRGPESGFLSDIKGLAARYTRDAQEIFSDFAGLALVGTDDTAWPA